MPQESLNVPLSDRLQDLPESPGVYLLKDKRGHILYVGKAKSLRPRVRSYFRPGAEHSDRIRHLVSQVEDVDWFAAGSELEAWVLESNLIKKHRPRYNVILRDDKNYPCLRFDVKAPFPRLEVVRRIKKDGALYFGPYVPSGGMWETLAFLNRTFPLRTCTIPIDGKLDRPCLEYDIGRCLAPCCDRVYGGGYAEVAEEVRLFLQGRRKNLLQDLRRKMEEAAEALEFEQAAALRDRIRKIERALEGQQAVSAAMDDLDVIALIREGGRAELQVFIVRSGMLVGRKDFHLEGVEGVSDAEIVEGFLHQFYAKETVIPGEVILPAAIGEREVVERWLSERRGGSVRLVVPRRGRKRALLAMAEENARLSLRQAILSGTGGERLLDLLRDEFRLQRLPYRVEAFDISNLQGTEAVGSLVVWEGGDPKRAAYRHFRIRTVLGADDFAMMAEVIRRRYAALLEKGDPLPDLILIDGGIGQLNAALAVLRELGISGVDVLGLAKARDEQEERVFLPGVEEAHPLPPGSPVSHFLQRVRDEAHRFAVTYHRKVRARRVLASPLDQVAGIGRVRKQVLLRHFGSLRRLCEASEEDLAAVPGIGPKVAKEIRAAMEKGSQESEVRSQ